MKKLLPVVISVPVFLSGCAVTSDNQVSNYVVNSETKHEIGTPTSDQKYISFNFKRKDDLERDVRININTFPFSKKFDLCETSGVYRDLKSFTRTKPEIETPNFSTEKENCDSYVSIKRLSDGNFSVSYEIKLLKGYYYENHKGYKKPLPQSLKYSSENQVFQVNNPISVATTKENGKLVKAITVKIEA